MKKSQIKFLVQILEKTKLDYITINKLIDLDSDIIKLLSDNVDNNNIIDVVYVAINDELQKNEYYLYYLNKILSLSNNHSSFSISIFIKDKKWVDKSLTFEIFNTLIKEDDCNKISYAVNYLCNKNILEDNNILEILNRILNSDEEYKAQYINRLAVNEILLKNTKENPNKRLEIIDKIDSCTSLEKAKNIYKILTNEFLLNYDKLDYIINKLLEIEKDYHDEYIINVILNKKCQESIDYIYFMESMLKTKNKFQCKNIYNLITNEYLRGKKEQKIFIDELLKLEDENDIKLHMKEIEKIIEIYKNSQYNLIKNVEDLIKYCYIPGNYDFIIETLSNIDEEEINSNTSLNMRIRKRKY